VKKIAIIHEMIVLYRCNNRLERHAEQKGYEIVLFGYDTGF
jgi:hypothetical protein